MNTSDLSSLLVTLVGVLVVILIVFLLFREFWCWYWKINERIALQKEMIQLLRGALRTPAAPTGSSAAAPARPPKAVTSLADVPAALSGAYAAWKESRNDRDYLAFLTTLSKSKHALPAGTTAEQLSLTFSEISDTVDFQEVLADG